MCGPILNSKTVKTRKPHNCWGCMNVFPAGTEMLSVASVDMDSLSTGYWCDNCLEYLNETPGLQGECFGYGDVSTYKQEMSS